MDRPRVAVGSRRIVISVMALALGCGGGLSPGGSPTTPQYRSLGWAADTILLSKTESGACSTPMVVGERRILSPLRVNVIGSAFELDTDVAGAGIEIRGTMTGESFVATYYEPPYVSENPCPPREVLMSGTFGAGRNSFDAQVVELFGSAGNELRLEWRWTATLR